MILSIHIVAKWNYSFFKNDFFFKKNIVKRLRNDFQRIRTSIIIMNYNRTQYIETKYLVKF